MLLAPGEKQVRGRESEAEMKKKKWHNKYYQIITVRMTLIHTVNPMVTLTRNTNL